MNIVQKAQIFATAAHAAIGQRRKYTFESYIVHPKAVVRILVEQVGAPDEVLAAGWLHDVLEDTKVTAELLLAIFEKEVTDLVLQVTDVSKPEDGNRTKRKALDLAHLAKASPHGKTIKLADIIDNTRTIVPCDPGFAKVYMQEKRAMLPVLRGGDEGLWNEANRQVEEYFEAGGSA